MTAPKSLAEQIDEILADATWLRAIALRDLGESPEYDAKVAEIKQEANAAILAAIQQTVMGVRPAFQNEHPTDPETGAAVETYGYEATYNQALKDWTTALETELGVKS